MKRLLERLVSPDVAGLTAYKPPEGDYRVRLDANESPHDLPTGVRSRIRQAFDGVAYNRYPDPASAALRKAFADRFGCRPEEVMAGNGSDELIALLLWTLRRVSGAGRPRILVPVPGFSMYALSARAAGYEVVEVPLRNDLRPDTDALLAAVERTQPNVIFLADPNNPTGSWYGPGEIEALLARASGLVVVDEAYADFSTQPTRVPQVAAWPNLAVLRTLSKVGGAALRCGFLAAGEDLLAEVNKVRLPFNVNALTQAAGEVILRSFEEVLAVAKGVAEERDRLAAPLADLGLTVFPSRANFLLVRAAGRESELFRFLQEGSIVVKFLPSLKVAGDALRITVGSQEENRVLLDRIAAFVRKI